MKPPAAVARRDRIAGGVACATLEAKLVQIFAAPEELFPIRCGAPIGATIS